MSKISLQPNASGTGTFTLAAPDSNTNRTLTLPDEAGVVLTDTSDIETQVKAATNASGSAPVYACRAWVNFDGSNGSIRASGNVSSVTRNGTGDYTLNFSTAMPDTNYFVGGMCGAVHSTGNTPQTVFLRDNASAPTTTSVRVAGGYRIINGDQRDAIRNFFAIFR